MDTVIDALCSAVIDADLRVLNKYQEVQSFLAFSSICNDTGLFGIHSITVSSYFIIFDFLLFEIQNFKVYMYHLLLVAYFDGSGFGFFTQHLLG